MLSPQQSAAPLVLSPQPCQSPRLICVKSLVVGAPDIRPPSSVLLLLSLQLARLLVAQPHRLVQLLAEEAAGGNADYYRRFVLAVKPDIKDELTHLGILKARDGEHDLAIEVFRSLFKKVPVQRAEA